MVLDNERIVRQAYQIAEEKDLKGWASAFTADGTFTDNSIGVVYRGPDGPNGLPVQVANYAGAFPDMHRELYQLYVSGDIVVVQLALQGTQPIGDQFPVANRGIDVPSGDRPRRSDN